MWKRSNLTKKEIEERDVKFEFLMKQLPDGTYPLPKLSEFIDKKIPGFKNKNTVRKAITEYIDKFKGSSLDSKYLLENSISLHVLAKVNPDNPSGSLQRFSHKDFYQELLD